MLKTVLDPSSWAPVAWCRPLHCIFEMRWSLICYTLTHCTPLGDCQICKGCSIWGGLDCNAPTQDTEIHTWEGCTEGKSIDHWQLCHSQHSWAWQWALSLWQCPLSPPLGVWWVLWQSGIWHLHRILGPCRHEQEVPSMSVMAQGRHLPPWNCLGIHRSHITLELHFAASDPHKSHGTKVSTDVTSWHELVWTGSLLVSCGAFFCLFFLCFLDILNCDCVSIESTWASV